MGKKALLDRNLKSNSYLQIKRESRKISTDHIKAQKLSKHPPFYPHPTDVAQQPERKALTLSPSGQWECWVWNLKEAPEPSRNDGLEWEKEPARRSVLPARYWGVKDARELSLPKTGSSAIKAQCHR